MCLLGARRPSPWTSLWPHIDTFSLLLRGRSHVNDDEGQRKVTRTAFAVSPDDCHFGMGQATDYLPLFWPLSAL